MKSGDHLLPMGAAALGVMIFAAMDAVMKGLALALGAFDAVFWRLFIAVPIAGLLFAVSRSGWPNPGMLRLHATRASVNAVSSLTFFWGLARMPLAEGIALAFVAPVIALYLAALLLGERIGRGVVWASLLCFAGVLLILAAQLRNPEGVRSVWGAASILISAALYAYNLVLLRRQAQGASPQELVFFQSAIMLVLFLPFSPFFAQLPTSGHLPLVVLAAALMILAVLLFAWAYRRAETQQLATLEYTALVWASMLGYLLFEEVLRVTTLLGAGLIIGGCLLAARGGRQPLSPAEAGA
jgi:S-adenosylmethionine uptake transporter